MTKDDLLRRVEYRTEMLTRLVTIGAPAQIIAQQRRMVEEARAQLACAPD